MRASTAATVVPFDEELADGAGDDAAHSTRVDRIRSQLEHSRATSRARRRKLTVPPLVGGVLGSLGGLTFIMLDQGEWTLLIYAGFVLGMSTSWLVVLPVLPVDRRLVLGATYLMLACNVLLATVFLALQALPGATRVLGVADCRVLYDAHDAFARVAWHGAFHLMFVLYYIAGLARWYRAPSRLRSRWATASVGDLSDMPPESRVSAPPAFDAVTSRWMLQRLWKVFGAFYVITGCGAAYALAAGLHFVPAYTRSERLMGEVGILLVSAPLAGFFWIPGVLQRVQAMLAAGGENVRTAASIASLLAEDMAPEEAIRSGRQRMRAILASSLAREVFATNAAGNEWYERSVPAHLEMVDAFVSHSWHDDPQQKWTELQAWCERFASTQGRQPYLWIDKCCIDQSNIAADLPSLPVFLAGCNRLLILAGDTYLQRLWCVVELFVFVQMGGTEVEMGLLPGLCQVEASCFGARFDARACNCFLAADYDRLLSCIEGACGTLDGFNRLVRELLLSAPKATYSELRTAEIDAAARVKRRSDAGSDTPSPGAARLLARALYTPKSPRDRGTHELGGANSASDGGGSARSWSSRSARSPLREWPKALARSRSASDSVGRSRGPLAGRVGAHRVPAAGKAPAPAGGSWSAPPPADASPSGTAPGGGTPTSVHSMGVTAAAGGGGAHAAGGTPVAERATVLVPPGGAPTPPRPRRSPRTRRFGRAQAASRAHAAARTNGAAADGQASQSSGRASGSRLSTVLSFCEGRFSAATSGRESAASVHSPQHELSLRIPAVVEHGESATSVTPSPGVGLSVPSPGEGGGALWSAAHRRSALVGSRRRSFVALLLVGVLTGASIGGLVAAMTMPAQQRCAECADLVGRDAAARGGRARFAYRGGRGGSGMPRAWDGARAACASEGRALGAVRTRSEAELAACACGDAPVEGVWLGLRRPTGLPLAADNTTQGWGWATGARELGLANWAAGQPRGDPSRAGCAVIGAAGKWEERPCDLAVLPFLCSE